MNNVLELLENAAACCRDELKIREPGRACSYRELAAGARRTATVLARFSCGRDHTKENGPSEPGIKGRPAAVFMEKGIDALTAFMGIVYAGGFYVMLNPRNPAARIRNALDVLDTDLLITDRAHEKTARNIAQRETVLLIEELTETAEDRGLLETLRRTASPDDLLYSMFTSGTTGDAKWVTISHRCVLDFMEYFPDMFGISEKDVIGNQAPFDFDVSVKDIYSAFKTGASLVIIPSKYFTFPQTVLDYLCDLHVTVLIWAVSALCLISMLKGFEYRVPEDVRKILFSGEAMPLSQLSLWQTALHKAEFVNLYGPTEITCNCLFYRIKERAETMKVLPVGNAFPGREVFLLDQNDRQITGTGVRGEICVGGTSVSPGYYHAKEATDKVFTADPRGLLPVIYRTGDIGYLNENGEFVFAGRTDFQIKHMGHRIELEEIEREISRLDGVGRAVCVYDEEKKRMTAFYTGGADRKELKTKLAERLPMYMIPSKFLPMENLPVTDNGKIDRRALLSLPAGKQ